MRCGVRNGDPCECQWGLEGPVSIFLGLPSHTCHGTLNGSIQIFARPVQGQPRVSIGGFQYLIVRRAALQFLNEDCSLGIICLLLNRQKADWKQKIKIHMKSEGSLATSTKSCVPEPIRILVVDDSRTFRGLLHRLLTSFSGLTIVGEAEDGQSAIEMASRLGPQVVTMDMQMPRLGGVEATRRIKKALPEVHVIGLSLHDDTVTRAAMEMVGASAFVSKEFADTLPQVIAKITGSQELEETFLEGQL